MLGTALTHRNFPQFLCIIPTIAAGLLLSPPVTQSAQAREVVTVETARGPATAPLRPAKIAALDVSVIDDLDALGAPVAGAPSPIFVAELAPAVADAARVGTLHEPDFEALARLGPDLIIAGGRSSPQVEQLARIAPTIDMTVWGEGHVEQALSRLEALGAITGREERAAALVSAFRDKLAEARKAADGKGAGLIIMANGPKISVFGAKSRLGWLHDALGMPEAASSVDSSTHGEAVSFEFIAETNPDWLFVLDRGAAIGQRGAGAMQTLDNSLVHGTNAWSKSQVILLNPADVYIAGNGVSAMSRTLDQLIAAVTKPQ